MSVDNVFYGFYLGEDGVRRRWLGGSVGVMLGTKVTVMLDEDGAYFAVGFDHGAVIVGKNCWFH